MSRPVTAGPPSLLRRIAVVFGAWTAMVGGCVWVLASSDAPVELGVPDEHSHHCPDAGVRTGDGWTCDVVHARLLSSQPFDAAPTAAQTADAASFADAVEASATRRFQDVDAARRAGYTFDERAAWLANATGTPWEQEAVDQLAAGTVTHLVNQAAAKDDAVADPNAPEALMYATDGNRFVLVGALFLARDGSPGPQIGGPLTTWHVHTEGDVVCWDGSAPVGFSRLLEGDERYEPSGGCAAGAPRSTSPEMLHVWFGRSDLGESFSAEMTSSEAARIIEEAG